MPQLTAIILTHNEAQHIGRAIASVQQCATRVLVVDSGSVDDTVALARSAGAEVLHHPWINYATQFNWALDQIAGKAGWILRLDADEVVTPQLAKQIMTGLPDVCGVYVQRRMCFQGQSVRHGGVFPIKVLRLFRNGAGRCETRWMDEHILVDGPVAYIDGDIIDDNHKPLDWWVAKHNHYASREVVDILNRQYHLLPDENVGRMGLGQTARKRWIKDMVYARLPVGLRAGAYFFYRYILRLGFLDGPRARSFHVLQGFWYRYLVDAKLAETRRYMAQNKASPQDAISAVLDIDIAALAPETKGQAA